MANLDFESIIRQEVEQVKKEAYSQMDLLTQRIYTEVQNLVSQPSVRGSEMTLGVKTGSLLRSIKFTLAQTDNGVEVKLWFDQDIAPHAKFVIMGTRYIKPHPILEQALSTVLGDDYLLSL